MVEEKRTDKEVISKFHKKELTLFAGMGSMLAGMFLMATHYMEFGTLDFFDMFPSHESIGLLLLVGGFGVVMLKMFNYKRPEWLKIKNSKKMLGKIFK